MVLSPVFLGAEPNEIDQGPRAGRPSLTERIDLGTALMAALPAGLHRAATVYEQMVDPAMPPGRVHPGDERHLAGAFQDNRVIPNEGVCVGDMPGPAQDLVMAIAEEFVRLLPAGPRDWPERPSGTGRPIRPARCGPSAGSAGSRGRCRPPRTGQSCPAGPSRPAAGSRGPRSGPPPAAPARRPEPVRRDGRSAPAPAGLPDRRRPARPAAPGSDGPRSASPVRTGPRSPPAPAFRAPPLRARARRHR